MPMSAVSNVERKGSVIPTLMHPHYKKTFENWLKWRLTYEGGDAFIRKYLVRFSNREDDREFRERRKLSYNPAFAKASIHEIRNAIYKRSGDIVRTGGPRSYQTTIDGKNNGVDLNGSSMNFFMGIKVLEELLVMGRVGIYVDMPQNIGSTLLERKGKRPYVYLYQAEDIRSYTLDQRDNANEFTSVLLRDNDFLYDLDTGLPTEECTRYRFLYLKETEEGIRVWCRLCNEQGYSIDEYNTQLENETEYEFQVGNLDRIPFTLLDIGNSLLSDAANYQIAHLNIASGDIWYAARANYPFYIEPFDPKSQSPYIKQAGNDDFDSTDPVSTVTTATNAEEITVGPTRGRRYPIGTNQPAFIHPSPEPLRASMAKQDQLKSELRQLINLSLAALNPSSSADSKSIDKEGLENGLSYLAMVLQHAENRVGLFWSLYEGGEEPMVQYPEQYQLLNQEQVDKEIETLTKLCDRTTSLTLKRRCMKIIAELKVSGYVRRDELEKIWKEIDSADVIVADVQSVKIDIEAGLVDLQTASIARGYPKDASEKAANDHAERLARIQLAQTPKESGIDPKNAAARGVNDLAGDPNAGSKEKQSVKAQQIIEPIPTDPTRGPGQNGQ